ncbi:pectate lyase family protein [Goodfellowiella coeruleoviolacea]|uniref:Pectate lyase n=1 Tax=Goodfellowiella coeruleoviolacea TaxID=334858 RepID=A0AAE3KFM1_9PSEU|nr:pectate lyase [Goodfellowiella coeruleoviolacea]MCP2166506.1 pectate lyase [Goodfellowiella coeruleoviolacea]
MGRWSALLATGLAAVTALAAAPAALAVPDTPFVGGPAGPTGWASAGTGTTGGLGAPPENTYVVGSRAELKAALANHGDPTAPKLIHVRGTIEGNQADDGRLLGEQDYAPGWNLDRYLACFGPDFAAWSDANHPWCKQMRTLRTTGSTNQKQQIQLTVPSNTTLVGLAGAALHGVYLTINTGTNIIVRNLHLEAPVDHFPSWDPGDGDGAWNARFDALSIVTGRNVWIDHCTFTDGRFPNSAAPTGPHGRPVERHDGLLDMEDATDYVTVSHNRFVDHEKTILIGSGDGKGDRDRGHLRITLHDNLFANTAQRSPRVRFGQVHSYNNYFVGAVDDADYPMRSQALGGESYFLGVGVEAKLVSEYNAFDYVGRGASADITVANFHGYQFVDLGSWFNGRPADVTGVARDKFAAARAAALADAAANGTPPPEWATHEFTTDVGWTPAGVYRYTPLQSALAVRVAVLANAGAGRLRVVPPGR